ncbi:MAG: hypothetical protein AAF614_04355 [Chloroflexota bacterium]
MSSRWREWSLVRGWLLWGILLGQTAVFFAVAQPHQLFWQSRQLTFRQQIAQRWQPDDYFARTQFIVANTPSNSLIILPPQAGSFGAIGNQGLTDYFLFPRRTAHSGAAEIDSFTGGVYEVWLPELANAPEPELSLDETFGILLVRASSSPPEAPIADFLANEPQFETVLWVLAKLGLTVLAGLGLVERFLGLKTAVSTILSAFLAGLSLNTVIYILLALVNISAGEWLQMGWLLAFSISSLWRSEFIRDRFFRRHQSVFRIAPSSLRPLFVPLLFFSFIIYTSLLQPIVSWDAMAIWGMKARVIYAFQSLQPTGLWGAWPEYPPLVPVIMAQLGTAGESATKLVFPLFGLALYGLVYEAMRPLKLTPWQQALLPLLPLLSPLLFEHTQIAYANLALTVYVTWAVWLWCRWIQNGGQPKTAVSFTLPLCGVTLARPDGEIYVAYLLVLTVFLFLWQKRPLRPLVGWLSLPVAVNLLWKLVYTVIIKDAGASSIFGTASQGQLLAKLALTTLPTLSQLGDTIVAFFRYTLSPSHWGLLPLLAILFLLFQIWQRRPQRPKRDATLRVVLLKGGFLGLSLAGLFFLAAYIAPHWGVTYFFEVTFMRLYMVLIPFLFIWTMEGMAKGIKLDDA